MTAVSILRHRAYNSNAYDLAMFDQVTRNTIYGNPGYTSLKREVFLKEHAALIYLPISFFYLVYNNPRMLLILQSFFLAFAVIPLYLLAKQFIKEKTIIIAFLCVYISSSYLWEAATADFHQETLVPLFFIFAFYFAVTKKWAGYWLSLAAALLCKEDMSMYSLGLGAFIIAYSKERKTRINGLLTIIAGLAWFYTCMYVIIPYFSSGFAHFTLSQQYSYLGRSLPEIAQSMIIHPSKIINHMFQPDITKSIIRLLSSVLFLPLFTTTIFLSFIPIFINTAGTFSMQYNFQYFYSMPVLPFIFVSAFYGLRNALRFLQKARTPYPVYLLSLVFIIYSVFSWKIKILPLLDNGMLQRTGHHEIIDKIIGMLPENSAVSAQNKIVSHLYEHNEAYCFPDTSNAQYIILDTKGDRYPLNDKDYAEETGRILKDKNYRLIYQDDGVMLIRKNTGRTMKKIRPNGMEY